MERASSSSSSCVKRVHRLSLLCRQQFVSLIFPVSTVFFPLFLTYLKAIVRDAHDKAHISYAVFCYVILPPFLASICLLAISSIIGDSTSFYRQTYAKVCCVGGSWARSAKRRHVISWICVSVSALLLFVIHMAMLGTEIGMFTSHGSKDRENPPEIDVLNYFHIFSIGPICLAFLSRLLQLDRGPREYLDRSRKTLSGEDNSGVDSHQPDIELEEEVTRLGDGTNVIRGASKSSSASNSSASGYSSRHHQQATDSQQQTWKGRSCVSPKNRKWILFIGSTGIFLILCCVLTWLILRDVLTEEVCLSRDLSSTFSSASFDPVSTTFLTADFPSGKIPGVILVAIGEDSKIGMWEMQSERKRFSDELFRPETPFVTSEEPTLLRKMDELDWSGSGIGTYPQNCSRWSSVTSTAREVDRKHLILVGCVGSEPSSSGLAVLDLYSTVVSTPMISDKPDPKVLSWIPLINISDWLMVGDVHRMAMNFPNLLISSNNETDPVVVYELGYETRDSIDVPVSVLSIQEIDLQSIDGVVVGMEFGFQRLSVWSRLSTDESVFSGKVRSSTFSFRIDSLSPIIIVYFLQSNDLRELVWLGSGVVPSDSPVMRGRSLGLGWFIYDLHFQSADGTETCWFVGSEVAIPFIVSENQFRLQSRSDFVDFILPCGERSVGFFSVPIPVGMVVFVAAFVIGLFYQTSRIYLASHFHFTVASCVITIVIVRCRRKLKRGALLREMEKFGLPLDEWFVDSESIELVPGQVGVLGKGSFGIVRRGNLRVKLNAKTVVDRPIAVKKMLAKKEELGQIVREIHLITSLEHPYIAACYGCFFLEEDVVCIVMQLCEGGELFPWLFRQRLSGKLTQRMRIEIMFQLALGLRYLHHELENPLVHRDLKPENVLVDGEGNVKIVDFGLSKNIESIGGTICGTAGYIPQSDGGDPRKIDVYAFALIFWEAWTLKRAYGELQDRQRMDQQSLLGAIFSGNLRPSIDECDGMEDSLRELICRCWGEADERPLFEEIVPFLERALMETDEDASEEKTTVVVEIDGVPSSTLLQGSIISSNIDDSVGYVSSASSLKTSTDNSFISTSAGSSTSSFPSEDVSRQGTV